LPFAELSVQCFCLCQVNIKVQVLQYVSKQIDLFVDPYKTNVLYNNLKDDMLPKQSSSQAWQGA
jgi:hypothetical protein